MKLLLLIIPLLVSGCVVPNPMLTLNIASPIEGKITSNGIPVKGAVITRKCTSGWYGDFPIETSISGNDGQYEIPPIKKFCPIILLHTPVIWQEFTVQYNGKTYLAHKNYRLDYSKYGELQVKHRFDNEPHSGVVGTNMYVYPADNRRYETNLSQRGKSLELNLELNKLNDYTPKPEAIRVNSIEEEEMLLKKLTNK